ncbi:MFS general substrate transporter [Aulographum hederae CBS 113979]|uniref:MFS general substrate transporter n=1 Tax=Aulographum hederae CBS 113979 TaxID=1176131 RepID=A0A6G1GV72_9PEZI|nr:MFS general substrate transporter [Aulographum hederae CBS 113979]
MAAAQNSNNQEEGNIKPPSTNETENSVVESAAEQSTTGTEKEVADPRVSSDRVETNSNPPGYSEEETKTKETAVLPNQAVTEVSSHDGTTATEPAEEEEMNAQNYLTGIPLLLLTIGLCLTTFTVALDNTIIATAIPRITTVFDSLNDVGWYGSAYLLTTCSLQPTFGKIYSFFNIKWTFIVALIIFEGGSILCAAAPNSLALIIGRAIAGAGASGLFSGSMTVIGFSVPMRKRAVFISIISNMFGIASVVGPILGGTLTDNISWRWCFWINLPFGGVAIAAVFFFFKDPKRDYINLTLMEKIREMDLPGAGTLISCIICLLLALQWGGAVYPWSDSQVWGCLLGFGLLLILFLILQWRRGERATLPPRILLRQRTVLVSALLSTFLTMALYTHVYYLPIYFQAVKGTSAEGSGIRTIAYLISNTVTSFVVGALVTALGHYVPFLWGGTALFAVGCGLLSTLQVNSGAGKWIGYQIMSGIGAGAAIQIPFIAIQAVLPEKDMPIGNAIAIFFNSLGGAISVSIAQNIFQGTLLSSLRSALPDVDAQSIISAGATGVQGMVPDLVSQEQLAAVYQSYTRAVDTAFYLPIATAAAGFLVSLGIEWKNVKGKKTQGGGGH